MMSIGQTFAITMKRIKRKWTNYALAVLVFLIPTLVVSALNLAAQVVVILRTGCSFPVFAMYFSGTMTEEQITELAIDPNVMNRTLYVVAIIYLAIAAISLFSIFFELPMASYFLCVVRERDISLGEALKFAWKSVPLTLMLVLKLIPWFLLFIIPGIIKAIQYSQTYYVKYDHPEWSALQCIKHSCKVTERRRGRLFLYMLMLSALSGVGQNIISIVLDSFMIFLGSGSLSTIVSAVIGFVATSAFVAYFSVFEQALYAVYYEDARRSYLADVEQNLRFNREHGSAGEHGDPFADDENSATVTYVGEAVETQKKDGYANNDHGDPFAD